MNLIQDQEGGLAATLDSPDQGAYQIPVTKIEFKNKNIYLKTRSINGNLRGTFNRSFKEFSGTWEQGGISLPLILKSNVVSEKEISVEFPQLDKVFGKWRGILQAGGVKLRTNFNFTKDAAGKLTVTMDGPDQGAKGIPISHIEHNNIEILMEPAGVGGVYQGKLDKPFEELNGIWNQGGDSYPLNLKRTQKFSELERR